MNYYEHHIGDYAKDAGHLSMVEDGAFRRLIDAYYSREEPLPASAKDCCKLARATTKTERDAVVYVLREFFDLREDGYHQKRCDEEIERFQAKSEKARRSANARWNASETHSEGNANASTNAMRTHSEGNAPRARPQSPVTNNQTPNTKDQDQELPPLPPAGAGAPAGADATAPPSAEMQAVIGAYHRVLPHCQRVSVLNAKRRKRIAAVCKLARQVCRQQGWPYVPDEFWGAYFGECASDPWMRGEVPNPKNPSWRQNLDVLLAEDRFARVMDQAISAMRQQEAA